MATAGQIAKSVTATVISAGFGPLVGSGSHLSCERENWNWPCGLYYPLFSCREFTQGPE
jgi:hypothetical protein